MTTNKLDVTHAWVQGPAGVSSSTSPIMEEIVNFHHHVMVYLTFILFAIAYLIWQALIWYNRPDNYVPHKYLMHRPLGEIIRTLLPVLPIVLYAMLWRGAADCTPEDDFIQKVAQWNPTFTCPSLSSWADAFTHNSVAELKSNGCQLDLTCIDLYDKKDPESEDTFELAKKSAQTATQAEKIQIAEDYVQALNRKKDLFTAITTNEIEVATTRNLPLNKGFFNFAVDVFDKNGTGKASSEPWALKYSFMDFFHNREGRGVSPQDRHLFAERQLAYHTDLEKWQILGDSLDIARGKCTAPTPPTPDNLSESEQVEEEEHIDWEQDPNDPVTRDENNQDKRRKGNDGRGLGGSGTPRNGTSLVKHYRM